jgi:trehalose-6-phosphate synthase
MNLVSYEYVACQQDRGGVLILSKHAGAADTLRGSLLVDPTDVDEIAQAIAQALDMDVDERKRRQQVSLEIVRSQTRYVCAALNAGLGLGYDTSTDVDFSASWGVSFTKRLREAK